MGGQVVGGRMTGWVEVKDHEVEQVALNENRFSSLFLKFRY